MDRVIEHKEWVAGVFDRASDSYDHIGPMIFSYYGKGLVEFANIRKGSRILDVACGRGAVLLPAAEAVGKFGVVIGIDLSKGMLTRLEADLEKRRIRNATIHLMDAEDLRFQDTSFDHVLCGFSLFFFPNLGVALDGFFRVLKPCGIIAVSTVKSMQSPWGNRLVEIRKAYQDNLAQVPAAEIKDLQEEHELTEELIAAGFEDVENHIVPKQFYFRDEYEWWDSQWSIFHRAFMERLDPYALEEYKSDVLKVVREHKSGEGIPTTIFARYTKAQIPADRALA